MLQIICTALALFVSSALLYYFVIVHPRRKILAKLPGPPSTSWLIGNASDVYGINWTIETFGEPGLTWMKKYGPAYHYRFLHTERIALSDPEGLKHVLVTQAKHYPRNNLARRLLTKLFHGVGLLSAEGEEHSAMRRILNPHFSHMQLKTFVPVFTSHVQQLIKHFKGNKLVDANKPVNLYSYFTKLTLDIIGVSAFGINSAEIGAYNDAKIQISLPAVLGTILIPGWSYLPFPGNYRQRIARQTLMNIVLRVIEAKMAAPINNPPKDLLDLMLASGPNMTSQEARTHVLTFMQAGHETTSNTLCWIIIHLSKHPQLEATVRAECKEVLKRHSNEFPWDATSELQLLTAVIQETLRFFPTVTNLAAREAAKDDVIQLSNGELINVPKNTVIWMDVAAMHRNPKYWTRPDEFLPERFIDGSELNIADKELRGGKPSTFYYFPFSAGEKNCIGHRFAILEMQIILVHLLSEFQFQISAKANLNPMRQLGTITPKKLEATIHSVYSRRSRFVIFRVVYNSSIPKITLAASRTKISKLDAWQCVNWDKGNYPEPVVSWLKKYGLAYYHRSMHIHRITLADPVGLKHVLVTKSNNYPRDVIARTLFEKMFNGIGLLSAHGAQHAKMRRILNGHFSLINLKSYIPIFEKKILHVIENLKTKNVVDSMLSLDMHGIFTQLTLDIIGLSSFGYDFGAVDDKSNDDLQAYEHSRIPASFLINLGIVYIPGLSYLPLPGFAQRRMANAKLNQIVLNVIDAKLQSKHGQESKDLLDILLMSGENISPADACVHVRTFLQAGHETTSNTLCWVLATLAQNPEVAKRVQEECQNVAKKFSNTVSWETLGQLVMLTAVIQETLRLHPTVPGLAGRTAFQDDQIHLSDKSVICVPKDTTIWIDIVALHRNPKYWTKPNKFLPERFIEGTQLNQSDKSLREYKGYTFVYLPFGAGDKNCIGQKFALIEMQVILFHLLNNFTFSIAKEACLHPKRDLATMKPTCLKMLLHSIKLNPIE
ncbi:hypothetical protein THRCLA_03907 [Thraustotheca clavata]|uniref:Cytochrome P450 n=1 Tax=Thraustotheca clavata TaxID=74557 RepID=A0A1W0A0H7_9STRA|nr:hypothetical protein THRCLA_03907 [Thraustotheca clavata]